MLTKNEIRFLKSLQLKKNREEAGKFLCEGEKVVEEALHSDFKVLAIYAVKDKVLPSADKIKVEEISSKEMAEISHFSTAPGIIALVEFRESQTIRVESLKKQKFLILDRINDPGNLGTIIRTADWFGIKHLFCSKDSVDVYNPKSIQSSMGSIFRTEIHYVDLEEFIPKLHELKIPVYAAVMDGKKVKNGFMEDGALMLGSESHGISKNLFSSLTERVTIPKEGKAESLNVGVAAGILMSMMKK